MTTNLLTPTPAAMIEQIQTAQSIVVVYGPHSSDDIRYTAQALTHSLIAAGKTATIASSSSDFPAVSFYPSPLVIQNRLSGQEQLVITVPLGQATLDELSYDTVGENLEITLVPKTGSLAASAVSVNTRGGSPDLLISLGVDRIEDFGLLYTEQSDIFTNTQRFNLSLSSQNDYSGAWNWVMPTASSYAELVLPLMDALSVEVTSDIATLLLAAAMSATQGFQDPKTTPDVLQLAARLLAAGARDADIVRDFSKPKPFAEVKLWGRALARITTLSETTLYTSLSQTDFQKTELTEAVIPNILRDIAEQITGYHSVFLTTETSDGVTLWFALLPHIDVMHLAHTFELSVPVTSPLGVGAYQYGSCSIPGGTQLAVEAKLRDFVTT